MGTTFWSLIIFFGIWAFLSLGIGIVRYVRAQKRRKNPVYIKGTIENISRRAIVFSDKFSAKVRYTVAKKTYCANIPLTGDEEIRYIIGNTFPLVFQKKRPKNVGRTDTSPLSVSLSYFLVAAMFFGYLLYQALDTGLF